MFTGIIDVSDFPFASNTRRDSDIRGKRQRQRERDTLGSPSVVEGGEVKPQMLEVIITLETRLI